MKWFTTHGPKLAGLLMFGGICLNFMFDFLHAWEQNDIPAYVSAGVGGLLGLVGLVLVGYQLWPAKRRIV